MLSAHSVNRGHWLFPIPCVIPAAIRPDNELSKTGITSENVILDLLSLISKINLYERVVGPIHPNSAVAVPLPFIMPDSLSEY